MANQRTRSDGELGPPESMLGFLLNQLAGAMRAETADALSPLGVTPRGLGLLLAVHEQPGISQTALRARLRIDRTTMSQLVDDLTEAGLLNRGVAAGDRRSSHLELTAAGLRTLHRGHAVAVEVERTFTADVEAGLLADVKKTLASILARTPGG